MFSYIGLLQIICDRKKKSGEYEYGGRFYVPMSDEWWFINNESIKRKLEQPHIEKVSSNRSYYYCCILL